MTVGEIAEALTGKERELLAQLIDVRKREAMLNEEISHLRDENEKLERKLERNRRFQTDGKVREQLKHALRELEATRKRCNPRLSIEEWKTIQEMRGICS